MTHEAAQEFVLDCWKRQKSFYKTRKWKTFRAQVLKKRKPRCEMCWNGGLEGKEERKYSPGEVAHHIQHLKDRPDLAFEEKNIMVLCKSCHDKVHPEKQHKSKNYIAERWD